VTPLGGVRSIVIVRMSDPVFRAASTATARMARVPSAPGVAQLPVYGALESESNWFQVPLPQPTLEFEHS
jgi:hypothetical protein